MCVWKTQRTCIYTIRTAYTVVPTPLTLEGKSRTRIVYTPRRAYVIIIRAYSQQVPNNNDNNNNLHRYMTGRYIYKISCGAHARRITTRSLQVFPTPSEYY